MGLTPPYAFARLVAALRSRTATRQQPATNLPPSTNFRMMKLLHTTTCVDDEGRWWRIETRHCQYTGLIIRERRRITD